VTIAVTLPSHRVGDYVHCTARIVNIFFKRLLAHYPEAKGHLLELMQSLSMEAEGLPEADRVAPRRTTPGTLDLTAANIFVKATERHALIAQYARTIKRIFPFEGGKINLGVAMEMLLESLQGLHKFWRQNTPLTNADLDKYHALASRFGKVWQTLGWKVSTWVHWTVRHSHALGRIHRNFYLFSSIPTERRNVEFKMDITHCFKGWKLSNPQASTRGFALVLDLAALDVGMLLHQARRRGHKRDAVELDEE
jgi:hypothetical protein